MDKIPIYLTEEECELFKKFRQYQSIWEKAFDIKVGWVTLHFNSSGEIRSVDYSLRKRFDIKK